MYSKKNMNSLSLQTCHTEYWVLGQLSWFPLFQIRGEGPDDWDLQRRSICICCIMIVGSVEKSQLAALI